MMDLTEAFGAAFSRPVMTVPTAPEVSAIHKPAPEVSRNNSSTAATLGSTLATSGSTPEVYVLNVEIGKDDCHLICVFLLVFSLSFILSNRK